MASQIDRTRIYADPAEANSPRKVRCDRCKVYSEPIGLRTNHINPASIGETYCPNCGHVHRAGANRDNH
jgi:late competence protein required for DNA uptake (superfamily II DNA/RNA helicase)